MRGRRFGNPALAAAIAAVLSQKLAGDGQKPLTRCAAARDGECRHAQCPQIRDNEPSTSARHCPLDNYNERD